MKRWKIQYWDSLEKNNPIDEFLAKLTQQEIESIFKEIDSLVVDGNELRLPHSKALGKGLFELRERRYGYRVYYCFRPGCTIVLLSLGDKASQEEDIAIARERLLELGEE